MRSPVPIKQTILRVMYKIDVNVTVDSMVSLPSTLEIIQFKKIMIVIEGGCIAFSYGHCWLLLRGRSLFKHLVLYYVHQYLWFFISKMDLLW